MFISLATRVRMVSLLTYVSLVVVQVIDHYENPRNVGSLDKNDASVGTGLVGAPACGDVMKLQVCASASM